MGCKHIPVSFSSARSETPCLTWKMPCPLAVLCSTKCLFLRRLAVPTSGIPFEPVFFIDTAIIAGVSTLILFPQIQAIPLRAHGRPRGSLSITTLYFILVIPHCSSSPFFSADTAFSTILFPIVLGSNGSTLTVCSILYPPILPIFGHKNNPAGVPQHQRVHSQPLISAHKEVQPGVWRPRLPSQYTTLSRRCRKRTENPGSCRKSAGKFCVVDTNEKSECRKLKRRILIMGAYLTRLLYHISSRLTERS